MFGIWQQEKYNVKFFYFLNENIGVQTVLQHRQSCPFFKFGLPLRSRFGATVYIYILFESLSQLKFSL